MRNSTPKSQQTKPKTSCEKRLTYEGARIYHSSPSNMFVAKAKRDAADFCSELTGSSTASCGNPSTGPVTCRSTGSITMLFPNLTPAGVGRTAEVSWISCEVGTSSESARRGSDCLPTIFVRDGSVGLLPKNAK